MMIIGIHFEKSYLYVWHNMFIDKVA